MVASLSHVESEYLRVREKKGAYSLPSDLSREDALNLESFEKISRSPFALTTSLNRRSQAVG